MKIALGCDHAGIELMPAVKEVLEERGISYIDFGTDNPQKSVDYPVYGARAARSVQTGECELGILLCGTGVGIGMAANKLKGIRCVTCSEPFSAQASRHHNNANMLSMGARVIGSETCKDIVRAFLDASFDGGRHERRVAMLTALENGEAIE